MKGLSQAQHSVNGVGWNGSQCVRLCSEEGSGLPSTTSLDTLKPGIDSNIRERERELHSRIPASGKHVEASGRKGWDDQEPASRRGVGSSGTQEGWTRHTTKPTGEGNACKDGGHGVKSGRN